MRNTVLAVLSAVLAIIWLGGCSIQRAPVGIETAAAPASKPAAQTGNSVPGPPPGKSGLQGGPPPKQSAKPGLYVVRTVWKGAPLSKAHVEWCRQIDDKAPALSGETISFGTANFEPASGSYYLSADWRPDGDFIRPRKPGDRFAWFGGNPLLVSSETSETITLLLEEVPPALALTPPAGTGIIGRVTLGGEPVADAGVYAYSKTGSGFKSDDFDATVRTDAKGEFVLDLPPGRYYLLARLRSDKSVSLGPLHKGDLLGYDPGNPLAVVPGSYGTTAIPMTLLKMIKSRAESSAFPPGTIEGRIIDRDGRPVPGTYAALYENQDKMSGHPAFMSEPTGTDGRFKLSVPIPGRYFLGARSTYSKLGAGAWFGTWNGSADHGISVGRGDVHTGLEIIVQKLQQDFRPSEP